MHQLSFSLVATEKTPAERNMITGCSNTLINASIQIEGEAVIKMVKTTPESNQPFETATQAQPQVIFEKKLSEGLTLFERESWSGGQYPHLRIRDRLTITVTGKAKAFVVLTLDKG
jgi:hypothetical protein